MSIDYYQCGAFHIFFRRFLITWRPNVHWLLPSEGLAPIKIKIYCADVLQEDAHVNWYKAYESGMSINSYFLNLIIQLKYFFFLEIIL